MISSLWWRWQSLILKLQETRAWGWVSSSVPGPDTQADDRSWWGQQPEDSGPEHSATQTTATPSLPLMEKQ